MLIRNLLGTALVLSTLTLAHAAEAEIYVTTGPDGIEIFSNLPRGPVAASGQPTSTRREPAVVASLAPAHQPLVLSLATIQTSDMQQQNEMMASGKSFLLDD